METDFIDITQSCEANVIHSKGKEKHNLDTIRFHSRFDISLYRDGQYVGTAVIDSNFINPNEEV